MADIKAIDKTTVHRICSGQVVLSLAIAVKELVENSLDAGASVIDVRFKEFGSEQIEVADNGSGIHPDNFQGLTLKHHTSKIQDFSDLMSVETFGFRGEALSSLCALSDLSVVTRHESQQCGTALVFDRNGYITEQKRQARQVGTSVFVKNLFSTLPVRQKEFHKNLKREFHKMTQLLYAYCLVSTGVKITCDNQTQKGTRSTLMSTQGSKSVKENISSLFGAKQLSSLLEVKQAVPPLEELEELKASSDDCKMFTMEGYVSTCAHGSGKAASNRQFYFINSRPCEPSKIIKQVNQVYHQFNKHQYPFVFLNICLDRGLADVNVTPDKRQIFLIHEKLVLAVIKASFLELYEKVPSTLVINRISPPNNEKFILKDQSGKPNLSKFEAWKHRSDMKRPSDSCNNKEVPQKQLKMDVPVQKTLECFDIKKSSMKLNLVVENITSQPSGIKIEEIKESNSKNDDKTSSASCDELKSNFTEECLQPSDNGLEVVITPSESDLGSASDNNCEFSESVILNVNNLEPVTDSISHTPITEEEPDSSQVCFDPEPCSKGNYTSNDVNDQSEEIEDNSESFSNDILSIQEVDKESSSVVYDEYEKRQAKSITISVNLHLIKSALEKRIEKNKEATTERKILSVKFHSSIDPSKNDEAEKELTKEISKDMFHKMEIIGQFNLGFIITKLDSDLLIIDQHASDEKYNFETLQKTTVLNTQRLVVPQSLDLAAEHECILMDNLEVFKTNGFKFLIDDEAPPTKKISLTAIPMSKNMVFGKEDIDEMIFMLQDSQGSHCRPSRVKAMFASRACRKSVMIGTALGHRQMRQLIDNMATIEQPWNCPHGRPTMRHLLNLDLINTSPL